MIPPSIKALAVTAVLAACFGAGWAVNGWRMGAEIAQINQERAESIAKGVKAAMADTVLLQRKKDEALAKAQSLAVAHRNSAAATAAESDQLRNALSAARADLPSHSGDACADDSTATDRLLDTVEAGVTRLSSSGAAIADQANGHARDSLTLQNSWPKDSK